MPATSQQAPIFLVSLRYRKESGAAMEAIGRSAVVVRRPEEALRRFAQSSSVVVVVDARGALDRGLVVARELSAAVEARRAAMVVLLSRSDSEALADVYQSGATHFLISPFGTAELAQVLRFADRYVRRMLSGGTGVALASAQASLADSARWDWAVDAVKAKVSPALAAMLGEPEGTTHVDVAAMMARVAEADRAEVRRALRRLAIAGVGGEVEHMIDVDGRPHKVIHHVRLRRNEAGAVVGLSATVEDLDQVLLERPMSAHFDALTGLANPAYARAWVEQLLGGRSAFDPACIVVLVGISRFDQINASYGRAVADALLQAVARRLRRRAGSEEATSERVLLARIAGAEFMVTFAGPVTLKDAVFFSQAVGDAFERPFVVSGRVIHLACRIGIAVGERDVDGVETLLRRASAALSQAKSSDPNSFQVYHAGEADDARAQRAELETDLRRAIEEDEIDILYQPQVEIVSNRIVGVEALVRWNHPTLGVLPPAMLLDVAEDAEIGSRLGEHILSKALGQAAAWTGELTSLRLAVNVTAGDMRNAGFDQSVTSALADTGFPAERFTLEVTETGLIENLENASETLARLRERGIRVAIDDFGTGYSSLAYLKSLPLDYLKVDKMLATDISGSARDRVVVRGVVDMARSLGMGVIAEGVETAEQLDSLVREGCNWYQGYLCAPPLSGAELAVFVADWNRRAEAA